MQKIPKKTWNPDFKDLKSGLKRFDVRLYDREYNIGDLMVFQEYDPQTEEYSGDSTFQLIRYIKYMKVDGRVQFGLGEELQEFFTEEDIKTHGLIVLGF